MAKLYQNRFEVAPSKSNIQRSQFNIPYNHKTTGNFGDLIPFYWQECLPGDVWQVSTRMLSRMSTPLFPVMDNAFIDYYYFFVPNRLVWSHWAEFLGENKLSAWVNDIEYIMPHAEVTSVSGGLLDHLGVPTSDNLIPLDICFLLPRCYWLCWNEWFRDENTTDPILINTGDSVTNEEIGRINQLCKVAKYHDQFTSALPSPQKGDAVDIPLAEWLPVVTRAEAHVDAGPLSELGYPLRFVQNGALPGIDGQVDSIFTVGNGSSISLDSGEKILGDTGNVQIGQPTNLWANTDGSAVSINALRQAFQMQRLLELQARSGSRYTEIIRASFSVISPDARLQRPEYLGGCRINLCMQQVAQTSATNDESPLGHLAAYSKTVSANRDFSYSCTEHGFILGLMCARTAHTYQQGLHKMWSRRDRYDLYWPTFAHLGEQPILRKELYAIDDPIGNDSVFGYQEAWYEYRFKANEVTGAFRSTVASNLDIWHYADYYESAPMLSEGFIEETSVNVDRTLAVQSSLHDQLLFDIQVDAVASRPLPLYSIPGMIDHF